MTTRDWMEHGTTLFLDAVDRLGDEDFGAATRLPEWSRSHVIAHVHYNAEALMRLLHWARTGERTPMYHSADHRNEQIEAGATLAPRELRDLVHASARALASAMADLSQEAWNHEVVTAQGRTVPAREVIWMRTREVVVHAVDLDAGVGFTDLPDDLNAALATDALNKRVAGGEAAVLAGWLTGRSPSAPTLGPWL